MTRRMPVFLPLVLAVAAPNAAQAQAEQANPIITAPFTADADERAAPAAITSGDDVRPVDRDWRFGRDLSKVGWETAGIAALMTATRIKDVTNGGAPFRFKNEGFFGRNTESLGMDKLHHGWKTYVIADVLQGLIEERTGERRNAAYSAAAISFGLLAYGEVLDGFTKRTGFSNEDMVAHAAGAGFALVRNAVPGLRQKLDFREQINPSGFGKDLRLVDQLGERKFLFAVQLSGWKRLENTPWRFVELHAGYYGRGFTDAQRARGDPLKRRLFVGIGFNVQALFARKPKGFVERVARGAFDYVQPPYVSINSD
jgi:hypothetical protein